MKRAKRLSPWRIVSIGISALRRHFVRFFFVTLLFSLTLSFFIFSFSTLFYDAASDYLAYYRAKDREYTSVTAGIPSDVKGINPQNYFKTQNDALKAEFPDLNFYPIYQRSLSVGMTAKLLQSEFPLISGTVVLPSEEEELPSRGFRLLDGRLPKNAEECCISELHYRLMQERGYQPDVNAKIIYPVRSFRDISMREVTANSGVVITGVVGTPFGFERYLDAVLAGTENNRRSEREQVIYTEKLAAWSAELYVSSAAPVFISEDYRIKHDLAEEGLYFKLNDDDRIARRLFRKVVPEISEDKGVSEYKLSDPYYNVLIENQKASKSASESGLIVLATFGVFTVLMMFNFIGVAIKIEQRQIGIYRTLGTSNGSVFGMFFTESIVSAIVAFAAASGITYLLSLLYRTLFMPKNLFLDFAGSLFLPEWYVFLVGAAFAAAVALIGTVIPFLPMLKKKPAELLREESH